MATIPNGRVRNMGQRLPAVHAMARGAAAPSAAAVSESELQRFMAITADAARAEAAEASARQARRAAACDERQASWGSSLAAVQAAKERARLAKLEADEERRLEIDAETAALEAARRERALGDANAKLHARDARVLALNSALLLHSVLEERAEQTALSARRAERREEADRREGDFLRRAAIDEAIERAAKAESARERAALQHSDCAAQLEAQKAQRREERARERREGAALRLAAEAEALDRQQARLDAVARARAIDADRARHNAERAAVAPAGNGGDGALSPRDAAALEADIAAYAARKAATHAALTARAQARGDAKDAARGAVLLQRALLPDDPIDGRVDVSARRMAGAGASVSDAIADGDDARMSARQAARQAPNASHELQRAQRERAREREEATRVRVSEAVAARLRAMAEEEADEARLRRSEAGDVARLQRLQAREKRDQREREKASDIVEAEMQARAQANDEEMYEAYVRSQLPASMPAGLASKVVGRSGGGTRLPRPPVGDAPSPRRPAPWAEDAAVVVV